jgi:NDP-sugar pyrophosphorylase family protein
MQAIILAGGNASRMGPEWNGRPKCMLEVAGRTILDRQLEILDGCDVDKAIICARQDQEFEFPPHPVRGIQIKLSLEDEPLGTGGAILKAAKYANLDHFYVLNGDIIPDVYMAGLIATSGVTMGIRCVRDSGPFGRVQVHFDGHVSSFDEPAESEKRHPDPCGPASEYINTGLYMMRRDILTAFPLGRCSLERDIFPQLVQLGLLRAKLCYGNWFAIDTIEDLRRAEDALHS